MCLTDVLRNAQQRLLNDLQHLLQHALQHHLHQPDLFAQRLQRALQEPCDTFAALRGFPPALHAQPTPDGVTLHDPHSHLELIWTHHGWTARPLGLHGDHLAACIAAWPSLHIPERPLLDPNATLRELRHLLHDPTEEHLERIADLLNAHLAAAVHDYAQRHINAWPTPLQRTLLHHQRAAFAEHSVALLRAQTLRALQNALDTTPTHLDIHEAARALEAPLRDALDPWLHLLDLPTPQHALVEPWGPTSLLITLHPEATLVLLRTTTGAWRVNPLHDDERTPEHLLALIDRIPPPSPLDDDEDDEDDALWSGEALLPDPREEACLRDYNHLHYPHLEDDADDADDELHNDDEHWLLQACLEGVQRGQLDGDDDEDARPWRAA